jgi:hypothetical protein
MCDAHLGDNCERVNHCATNPCSNSARCETTDTSYICHCLPGMRGERCMDDINECDEMSPCQNGATCTNSFGSYRCVYFILLLLLISLTFMQMSM